MRPVGTERCSLRAGRHSLAQADQEVVEPAHRGTGPPCRPSRGVARRPGQGWEGGPGWRHGEGGSARRRPPDARGESLRRVRSFSSARRAVYRRRAPAVAGRRSCFFWPSAGLLEPDVPAQHWSYLRSTNRSGLFRRFLSVTGDDHLRGCRRLAGRISRLHQSTASREPSSPHGRRQRPVAARHGPHPRPATVLTARRSPRPKNHVSGSEERGRTVRRSPWPARLVTSHDVRTSVGLAQAWPAGRWPHGGQGHHGKVGP